MIGVDTNILVRYVLDDDPVWSPIATRFIESDLTPETPGYINPVTLAELAWALRRHQNYDRARLATVIEGLLTYDRIVVGEADAVFRALAAFRQGGAGFADYLIAELNAAAGARPTMTIDRKAAARPLFSPLS